MKKLLLGALLLIGSTTSFAAGSLSVGAGLSNHYYQDSNLNYIHPLVSYETEHYGSMAYLNSFDKLGLAVYAVDRHRISRKWSLAVRYGVIYGYKPLVQYKERDYTLPKAAFIGNTNLLFGAAPALEYTPDNNITFQFTSIGKAAAFVWKLKL